MGAQADTLGVNFCVWSTHATQVDLCLFDASGQHEIARLPLPGRSGELWHGHLAGAAPGQLYGLRVQGPWQPERGHRFNPNKLLLDPWAHDIVAPVQGFSAHAAGAVAAGQTQSQEPCPINNAAQAFKSCVVQDAPFDWQGDAPPHTALAHTVVYEVHVRGFTKRMPDVPQANQGTYAGLGSAAAVAHLKKLGVTALSLLPVQHILDEPALTARGLVNYWGYNTLGYFCPDPRYASTTNARQEFKAMVRSLHAAGIEVLLDVVYNHTAESDANGPTLCWRGLDNAAWYRMDDHHPGQHLNYSGCGNTLDLRQPRALQMVMDSLRHWVQEFHVDGFRFDLAPTLARANPGFERDAPFFKARCCNA
jgi:glycogen debranching enzyme